MRPRLSLALLSFFLVLCTLIAKSESKLQQQQASLDGGSNSEDDDDDEDDDDFDQSEEDGAGNNYPSKQLSESIDDEGRAYKNPRKLPSAQCPRDEEQAEILGQKCLRKCSTDKDCKSKKKKCRCDGVCGMSCIKLERECLELLDIEHGLMLMSGGRFFGDRVNYSCDPGYYLVGLAERTCRADGRWTGLSQPTCKSDPKSFCSPPSKLPNARHNALPEQLTFDLDSVVQYFCEHGYETKGSPKAKCLAPAGEANWYGPDIVCEPKSCNAPPDIANGWHAGECYKYDCHVAYHCADGYELVGKAEKICVADGSWLPAELPKCVEVTSVQCTNPEHPVNGKAIFTSISYNAIVSYECKTGYTIVGMSTRRCGADGKWTGHAPVCKEIDCGSPGVLYNGWIDNIENGTRMGASLIFRCNERMKLEGHSSSLCQLDGKWSYPLPQCLAPCVLPDIPRGHVYVASNSSEHINNVTVAEHGKQLAVECIADYEFAASDSPVVCNNGTWSIMPSCTPARCKQMPKPPRNGMVIAPKTEHGMKAVFKCKDGFEMIGGGPYNSSFSVECQYGNWTGDVPHCIEVYCPFPGYVENGKVLLVGNMGVYDYRPYVKKIVNNKQIMYDCDKGYYLSQGPPGATCIGGSWSPKELPKCTLGQHPRIRWNRRRRSVAPEAQKNETVVLAYRKFIDFFRKIGKKLLELEMEKSRETLSRELGKPGPAAAAAAAAGNHNSSFSSSFSSSSVINSNSTSSSSNVVRNSNDNDNDDNNNNINKNNNNNTSSKIRASHSGGGGGGGGGKPRSKDEKMIDFLRVVYRKLQRIDSRHASNDTNVTMHELLNAMSKNLFHVDLAESKKKNANNNSSAKEHESYESKAQREFTKLKREFERIMKFYNKSLRWSEKHLRKDLRKKKKNGQQKGREGKDKRKQQQLQQQQQQQQQQHNHKSPNYYKGFYEFVNDYVTQKLSALEAQNATEELIRKMKIERMSSRNGTMFTVGEIYAFFKHIIEVKLNSSKPDFNETTSTTSTTTTTATSTITTTTTAAGVNSSSSSTTTTTSTSSSSPSASSTTTATKPKATSAPGASSTTTKASHLSVSENEIPSLELENGQPKLRSKRIRDASTRSPLAVSASAGAAEVRRKLLSINHPLDAESTGPEAPPPPQSRAKRFLSAFDNLDNQTFLKNLYVGRFEEEYKANVKRSIKPQNNQRDEPAQEEEEEVALPEDRWLAFRKPVRPVASK